MTTIRLKKQHCHRCQADFWPRMDNETDEPIIPKHCPKCNSPYWKTPVVNKAVSEARRK